VVPPVFHPDVLHGWVTHRVTVLLTTLARHLQHIHEAAYLHGLLEQCLYCGALSRSLFFSSKFVYLVLQVSDSE
jgi:hypothetical protein